MQVSHHFVSVFYQLPPESFDALVQCAISALSLQERYSLVAASTFLVNSTGLLFVSGIFDTLLSKLLNRPRSLETRRRTTISLTRRSSSSTLMDGRSYAHCLLALPVSHQSQPFQISSSYSPPLSQKCRWKANNGFSRSYTGFVLHSGAFATG
jgi:hypothetical protein